MVCPRRIVKILETRVIERFNSSHDDNGLENTSQEKQIADRLFSLLKDFMEYQVEANQVFCLEFEENCIDESLDGDTEESQESSSSQDWESQEYSTEEGLENFELGYMVKVLEVFDKHGFSRVKQRFKRVKHHTYIHRFRKYVEQVGTKALKLARVQDVVHEQFSSALLKREIIHDFDIKRWAVECAKQINLTDFKASDKWLLTFKRKYKIVSRKITKFVTNFAIESPEILKSIANRFVTSVRESIVSYNPEMIFNSDQSGFCYLIKSSRMHTIRGEKIVVAHTDSEFKRTHSYTIQPIVSLAGQLKGKLLIVLQESGLEFGPRVQQQIDLLHQQCKNVVILCSKSGKLHKEHVKVWVERVFSPLVNSKSIMLLDSWRGQKDEDLFESISQNCSIMTIPEKTTGYCQPLDVYGFRQWKAVIRKITSRVDLDASDTNLTTRSNIVILQSLIHNQLSAPVFNNMWKYGWYKSGYTLERPDHFTNANDTLFPNTMNDCDIENCEYFHIIRCSHCKTFLCLQHFFVEYHYHDIESVNNIDDNDFM